MKEEEIDGINIKQEVKALIRNILRNPSLEIDEKCNLIDDLGMDSISLITLVVKIEDSYCITFSDEALTMATLSSFEKLTNLVEKSIKNQEIGRDNS